MTVDASAMGEIVPLLQTVIWASLVVGLLVYFRKEIQTLRTEVQKRLANGDGLELGPIKLLEQRVQRVQMEVDAARSFILAMGDNMYLNLKKIETGYFGHYTMEESSGLWRELYHLRDIGYIRVEKIRSMPRTGKNLSQYVTITEVGRRFVALREEYLANEMPAE